MTSHGVITYVTLSLARRQETAASKLVRVEQKDCCLDKYARVLTLEAAGLYIPWH